MPEVLLGLQVQASTLARGRAMTFPRLVKAIDDKRIAPRVYADVAQLPARAPSTTTARY